MARRKVKPEPRTTHLSDRALECRGLLASRHAYVRTMPRPVGAETTEDFLDIRALVRKNRQRMVMLNCPCGRWRRMILDENGVMVAVASGYTDPDGYLMSDGKGRLSAEAARSAFLLRVPDDE
jgi:hypothetical protein